MRRTLSPIDGGSSGKVTLPKGELELDGLVDTDGNVERRQVDVRRRGRGRYEIVILDDQLRPLDETSVRQKPADD